MFFNEMLRDCCLCPRKCHVNRLAGQTGFCKETASIRAARAELHMWEEPCLSGGGGAGAVFFTGCNLRCCFCQNAGIAAGHHGREISSDRLCEIFFELQEKGADNIDLVTPTHHALPIAEAIDKAKKQGFALPFIYNCGGYESVETIRELEGRIDIWMPDFKYADDGLAEKLSGAGDYSKRAKEALQEMVRQQPETVFDKRGLMKRGILVRHLVLPGHIKNSRLVLSYLYETYGDKIWLSLMSQYTPMREFPEDPALSRSLTHREYEKIVDFALRLGFKNAYIQEGGVNKASFIPAFDLTGI